MKPRFVLGFLLLVAMLFAPFLPARRALGVQADGRVPESPLIIQTRPALPGIAFTLDGRTFVSNREGLALILVTPGSHELSVTTGSQQRAGRRIDFAGWSDGQESLTRSVNIPTFTHLEAGFKTSSPVELLFQDRAGRPIGGDDVDRLELLDDRGTRISASPAPLVLRDTRLKATRHGFTTAPVTYSVRRAEVGKLSLPATTQEFVPQSGSRVTVTLGLGAASRASSSTPAARSPGTRMPVSVIALASAAGLGIFLLARSHRRKVLGRAPASKGRSRVRALPSSRRAAIRDRAAEERKGGDIRRVAQLVGRFMSGQKRTFGLALGMLVFEAATAVLEAAPIAYLIDYLTGSEDELAITGLPSSPVTTIGALTLGIILLAMINSAADSRAEIYLSRGGRTLGFRLRTGLFAHLHRLSLAYHDRRRTGDVITRVTGDVRELEEFVEKSVSDIVGSFLLVIGTLTFLATQSWHVTLVAVAIIPVLASISRYFSTRIKTAAKKQKTREGELASSTQEMLTSIRVVQTFAGGTDAERTFGEQSSRAKEAALEAARLEAWFSWIVSVMKAVAIGAVVWIGWGLVQRQLIGVGILVMSVTLIEKMFKPTRKIIKEWNTFGKVYASAERIADVLDREATVKDKPGAVPAPRFTGRLRFENVTFSYRVDPDDPTLPTESSERRALSNVSFELLPGEVVALVGHSGAGKSSVAQLVPRLYDPQEGRVLFDERDVRDFTLESVRSQIAVVLQDTVLFSGTVAQNISYGRPNSTRAEIEAAARSANADEFITQMKDGYDTELSERASNLSGGQRQRIAIARALIRQTPLLILDEPTTALDAASTEQVLGALRTLMKGKTTLLISHDMNLIRTADRILVVERGRIVQSGRHDELLESDGPYRRLCQTQYGDLLSSKPKVESKAHAGSPPALPAPSPVLAGSAASGGRNGAKDVPPGWDALGRRLPGLNTAFDRDLMKERLERAHLRSGCSITHVEKPKALYTQERECIVHYRVRVAYNGGPERRLVIGARLFSGDADSRAFADDRLGPLAAGGKADGGVSRLVATHDDLALASYVFPIDAELPALVRATDPSHMAGVLRDKAEGSSTLKRCHVEIAHYPRRHRCVLRYEMDGEGIPTLYGKLAVHRNTPSQAVLAELKEWANTGPHPFDVPRLVGFHEELGLALLEAIPGEPALGRLIKRCSVEGPNLNALLELTHGLDMCGRIAARVHASKLDIGNVRTLESELAGLNEGLDTMRLVAPQLEQRLCRDIDMLAEHTLDDPCPLVVSHGDFTHSQVLFSDRGHGLLDFDSLCRAEPALDLGSFLAYLRVAMHKAGMPASTRDRLCARFTHSYCSAADLDHTELVRRVNVFEAFYLVRMAVRSWHQLKAARVSAALSVLEGRLECLPPRA